MAQNSAFLFGYTNIIVNGIIIIIILFNFVVHKFRKLLEAEYVEQKNQLFSLSNQGLCTRFSLDQMQRATSNFCDELVIGKGGFGKVYKGNLGVGPSIVAIKRSQSMSSQGLTQFLTEIEMLTKLRHSHLVSLIGYCDDSNEMILVYEYMPGGTLADHLHKRVEKGDKSLPPLSWIQRLKICIGAARGLDYLHTGAGIQHRVIHRDVKTTNILLDENLAAKVSDFGLSKIGPANQAETFVSTRVEGTFGYFDPYYFQTRRLTRKSDVYAFGVVLLEALCGRPALDKTLDEDQMGLAGWAQDCFKEGLLDQIIDPRIKEEAYHNSLKVFVDIAIKCLHNQPKHRPTMAEVVVGLESALALQEKRMEYVVAEIVTSDYESNDEDNTDLTEPEVENENFEREMVDVPNSWHYDMQSSGKMTLRKKISVFLSHTAQALSGNKDAKRSRGSNDLPPSNSCKPARPTRQEDVLQSPTLKSFKFSALRIATREFHSDSLLGNHIVGQVYKGWINEHTFAAAKWGTGRAIAVTRLNQEISQGPLEWLTEINYLDTLCHPNIVKVIGYCSEKEHRLIVYEFMSQGSLDRHLHMRDSDFQPLSCQPLSWNLRISIALGAAKGIAYLHSPEARVIHRDIRSSHILLDSNYNAKLSDFWVAKEGPGPDYSHLSTAVVGTLGYLDPHYLTVGHVTMKSDIYSYGVVLLEILTGRKAIGLNLPKEEMYLVAWATHYLTSNCNVVDIMDKRIEGQYTVEAVVRVSSLALKCLSLDPISRPEAKQVVKELEEIQQMDNSGIIKRDANNQAFFALRPRSQKDVLQSPTLKRFTFNALKLATRKFHSNGLLRNHILGQVYKGWINEHTFAAAKWGTGRAIAVRRLNQESSQGHLEWLTEIDYLDTLWHPNIVKVIGYCSEKKHRLIVYEFMSQGSLDRHLHMRDSNFQPLSWNLRISIALGAARGIAYLHSPEARVIHRDIKSSHILLDFNYNAKLSDFWVAKEGPGPDYSHLSTVVVGTLGYLDPQYFNVGHLTMKSDIYSYGVVLLEILTGQRAYDRKENNMLLVSWVEPYLTSKRNVVDIMDKGIEGQYTVEAALRVSSLALKCVSVDPKSRPEAKEVVKVLEELQHMENPAEGSQGMNQDATSAINECQEAQIS